MNNNYTWFFNGENKSSIYSDKIGINTNCTYLMHDNMIFGLSHYKKIEKIQKYNTGSNIKNVKMIYLIYKINDQPNTMLSEISTTLYFKYVSNDIEGTNMRFKCIGFNGDEFK